MLCKEGLQSLKPGIKLQGKLVASYKKSILHYHLQDPLLLSLPISDAIFFVPIQLQARKFQLSQSEKET